MLRCSHAINHGAFAPRNWVPSTAYLQSDGSHYGLVFRVFEAFVNVLIRLTCWRPQYERLRLVGVISTKKRSLRRDIDRKVRLRSRHGVEGKTHFGPRI